MREGEGNGRECCFPWLSYTSWKSLQNHSRDLSVLLAECPMRLLVVSWANIPCAQLFVWGRDGLKSSRLNWECLWMSGHCASVSPCEVEGIIAPFFCPGCY